MNQPLNVVMADSVWCTASDGLDFSYPTIMLTSYECGMFCALDEQEPQELMQAAGPPPPTVKVVAGPRKVQPFTSIPEYLPQMDSDWSDTDPESLLTEEATANIPVLGTGEAIPCICPVCKANLTSGMALFCHLRSEHLEERPYACNDCKHCFNNLKELSSHCSNIHRRHKVLCNQNNNEGQNVPTCPYTYWWCSMSTVWMLISYINWDTLTWAPPQWKTDFWLLRMWCCVPYIELIADSPNRKTWWRVHLWNVWQEIWHTCTMGSSPKEMWILVTMYVKLLYNFFCFVVPFF